MRVVKCWLYLNTGRKRFYEQHFGHSRHVYSRALAKKKKYCESPFRQF
ncbi:helix-turn-helix domain-containing protein [Photorhabdus tasmaniensis]